MTRALIQRVGLVSAAGFVLIGCVTLFGWDIHAPGILSEAFFSDVHTTNERVALYLESETYGYVSKDRGSKTADPQTFHVGEAFAPMLVEGFQTAFGEFIFFETEPTIEMMTRYGIPYLAVVRVTGFKNRVTWKGQAGMLKTETFLFNERLEAIDRFETRGVSDAKKVFAKKGGPEVNLNSAIENNIRSVVLFLQDALEDKPWQMSVA